MAIKFISVVLSAILMWWGTLTPDERWNVDPHIKAIVCGLEYDEFVLFSATVEAESDRGDDIEGRTLIALTILNRVNSSEFPDTITGVINEPGQFEVVSNGMVWSVGRTNISDMAIIEAFEWIQSGDAPNVMYFNATGYVYGTPYGVYGGNYFVTVP